MTAAYTKGPWCELNRCSNAVDFGSDATGTVRPIGTVLALGNELTCEDEANAALAIAAPLFVVAAQAAIAYDAAIEKCANDPDTMASFCTAEGDDLDALYLTWITLSREALQAAGMAS